MWFDDRYRNFEESIKEVRSKLLFEEKVFTGVAGTNTIRLLPPLCLTMDEAKEYPSLQKVLTLIVLYFIKGGCLNQRSPFFILQQLRKLEVSPFVKKTSFFFRKKT